MLISVIKESLCKEITGLGTLIIIVVKDRPAKQAKHLKIGTFETEIFSDPIRKTYI